MSGRLSPIEEGELAGAFPASFADLISRERIAVDERVVRISATREGLAMEARATPVRLAVESATGLDESEFVELRERLHQLRSTIATHQPPQPVVG